ncbi:MAG: undecaprenyl/decaprenyl-phosphate alpha-N-acetylglucosaminyl 1-phosphate transferase [Bacteroidetes bacterium]|nr:undecaprenyl/decaprenyl-phosphate alpha-N-acetylglucosaminyl 1-phosphate transferase [Bacteroidota bacterium]
MSHLYFILSIVLAFLLVVISIPAIVRISVKKHLFEKIDDRKIHKYLVPTLGGIAIFLGFILSTIISTNGYSFDELKYIIASIIFVFFIGLKDDLIIVSNRKKFVIQVFAALLLIFLGNIRLTNFHGFLGLHNVNFFIGSLTTLFLMVLTINAYNLIDGIDGLASGLAMVAAFTFGVWFVLAKEFEYAVMSFALVGSLLGFFIYNVFGTTNKIFMGDAGSLVIGLTMSALLVRYNQIDSSPQLPIYLQEAPAVSFAIVLVPLIDTLRVFAIRIKQGKSPFAPDTNHVHHRLLRLFGNHLKVTLTIVFVNGIFVVIAVGLNYLSINIHQQFLILIILALIVSYIPAVLIKRRNESLKTLVYNQESSSALNPAMLCSNTKNTSK